MTLVLDASVAVKWFLPPAGEDLVPEAFELLRLHETGDLDFIVPDIFWAEFANVCWMAARRKRLKVSEGAEALSRMLESPFPTVTGDHLLKRALTIALEHDAAVYDSLYVALAEESRWPLITADQRLVNALGSRFPVRWLGAFSMT